MMAEPVTCADPKSRAAQFKRYIMMDLNRINECIYLPFPYEKLIKRNA